MAGLVGDFWDIAVLGKSARRTSFRGWCCLDQRGGSPHAPRRWAEGAPTPRNPRKCTHEWRLPDDEQELSGSPGERTRQGGAPRPTRVRPRSYPPLGRSPIGTPTRPPRRPRILALIWKAFHQARMDDRRARRRRGRIPPRGLVPRLGPGQELRLAAVAFSPLSPPRLLLPAGRRPGGGWCETLSGAGFVRNGIVRGQESMPCSGIRGTHRRIRPKLLKRRPWIADAKASRPPAEAFREALFGEWRSADSFSALRFDPTAATRSTPVSGSVEWEKGRRQGACLEHQRYGSHGCAPPAWRRFPILATILREVSVRKLPLHALSVRQRLD
jgi:hypothetical protein